MRGERSELLERRIDKLALLRERGIRAFAYRYDRTHRAREALECFEKAEEAGTLSGDGDGDEVGIPGRLVSYRSHGRSAFAHIEDESGRIQLYFREDLLGDAFGDLGLLDLGDWVGARGALFRTRTGEVTVRVSEWELLTKSLRPLPLGKVEIDDGTGERMGHGTFSDIESRYRRRYADLAVHPEVRELFRTRSRMIRALREFMDGEGFLEVETPALQPLYGGAIARPFVTHHNALDRRMYLRIADELYLKRLLVGGLERVYEIAKDFRNEGIGRLHNPEFTMLEFYQAFADYHDMMALVERMLEAVATAVTGGVEVHYQGEDISFKAPYERIVFHDALSDALGEDAAALSEDDLREFARRAGGIPSRRYGARKAAGQALRDPCAGPAGAAGLRHRSPARSQPLGQGPQRREGGRRALRALRVPCGASQRFFGAQRSNRSAEAIRGPIGAERSGRPGGASNR